MYLAMKCWVAGEDLAQQVAHLLAAFRAGLVLECLFAGGGELFGVSGPRIIFPSTWTGNADPPNPAGCARACHWGNHPLSVAGREDRGRCRVSWSFLSFLAGGRVPPPQPAAMVAGVPGGADAPAGSLERSIVRWDRGQGFCSLCDAIAAAGVLQPALGGWIAGRIRRRPSSAACALAGSTAPPPAPCSLWWRSRCPCRSSPVCSGACACSSVAAALLHPAAAADPDRPEEQRCARLRGVAKPVITSPRNAGHSASCDLPMPSLESLPS